MRDPSRLPADARRQVVVHNGDLDVALPPEVVRGHDALINCAGNVADGERFVSLVDRVVTGVESLSQASGPSAGSWQGPRCSISMLRVAAASSCPR